MPWRAPVPSRPWPRWVLAGCGVLVLVLVLAVAALVLPGEPATVAPLRGQVIWNGDADEGDVPPWSPSTRVCRGGAPSVDNQYRWIEGEGNVRGRCPSVELVQGRTRTGSGRSMRVHLPPGSVRATASSTLRWRVPSDARGELDQYVGLSVYFAEGFPGSTWMSPISWRTATGDTGSLVVQKEGERLVFRRSVNTSWDRCRKGSACSNDDLDMGAIVQGEWIDFVFRVRYSAEAGSALRQVWRNGELMGTSDRPNVLGGSTYRFRVGLYQSDETRVARTVYYDSVRIGTSYDAVDPAPRTDRDR